MLVGDAFAFLDPVFSSSVYLAMRSGESAGDAVHDALKQGDTLAAPLSACGERLCREIEWMRKLVYALYDHAFSFGRLIRDHPDLRADLTDCLIGNLDKDFTRLFDAVAEQATVPSSLPYGNQKGRTGSLKAAGSPRLCRPLAPDSELARGI